MTLVSSRWRVRAAVLPYLESKLKGQYHAMIKKGRRKSLIGHGRKEEERGRKGKETPTVNTPHQINSILVI